MTDNEINKIIAEYMGWIKKNSRWFDEKGKQRNYLIAYTESLDSLVPVWEKLEYLQIHIQRASRERLFCFIGMNCKYDSLKYNDKDLTTQQAAAHATCKAILELTNNN